MEKLNITALILTKDEEKHIKRCIHSVKDICKYVLVVDSFSSDKTCEYAEQMGARVVQHEFKNQAQQFNWALDNLDIQSEWIWRIDADEYVSTQLAKNVSLVLPSIAKDVNGNFVDKLIIFLGKPLFHGSWHPAPQLKIIRKGHGRSENKPMDEHLVITDGRTVKVNGDQVDDNLNSLSWWIEKHNRYADREALNMLSMAYGLGDQSYEVEPKFWGNAVQRKRWWKMKYVRMPLYIRPFINFIGRYIIYGGFLDGNHRWYVLQCFWYRYLVDAKIYEIKKHLGFDETKIKEYLKENFLETFNIK